MTDGFVGVEPQTYRFIRERLDQANLFAFGIGSSVNRGLIEGMARAGRASPSWSSGAEKAAAEAERFRAYIEQPVLTQVSVSFHGFGATDIAPEKLPDLMARRPLILFGKYRGPASGRIEITGATGTGRFHQTVQVRPDDLRQENAALRWLWARKRVALLDDDRQMAGNKTAEEAITRLGLEYNLLTAFTSFVAIDSQVVNQGGKATTVKQPLPLPEGVSELAVGNVAYRMGAAGAAPAGLRPGATRLGESSRTSQATRRAGLAHDADPRGRAGRPSAAPAPPPAEAEAAAPASARAGPTPAPAAGGHPRRSRSPTRSPPGPPGAGRLRGRPAPSRLRRCSGCG